MGLASSLRGQAALLRPGGSQPLQSPGPRPEALGRADSWTAPGLRSALQQLSTPRSPSAISLSSRAAHRTLSVSSWLRAAVNYVFHGTLNEVLCLVKHRVNCSSSLAQDLSLSTRAFKSTIRATPRTRSCQARLPIQAHITSRPCPAS